MCKHLAAENLLTSKEKTDLGCSELRHVSFGSDYSTAFALRLTYSQFTNTYQQHTAIIIIEAVSRWVLQKSNDSTYYTCKGVCV